jgi:hypothetical protein
MTRAEFVGMVVAGYLFTVGVTVVGALILAGVIEAANGGLLLRVVSGVACILIGTVVLFGVTDHLVHGKPLNEHVERDPWPGRDPFDRVDRPPPPPSPY